MSSDTVKFRLKKGFHRAQVAVQELEDDVVLAGDAVYETGEASVVKALDTHHAFERVAKSEQKEKA